LKQEITRKEKKALMQPFAPEIVSIAETCLGGLQGRSAFLIGPEERCEPYKLLLQQAGMKYIYQEETYYHVSTILPHVQLLMNLPAPSTPLHTIPLLTASTIARGCIGRRTPLLIFDLADSSSIEELAGLLPTICLYTPDDLRQILSRSQVQIS
jgi:hypothetical protein